MLDFKDKAAINIQESIDPTAAARARRVAKAFDDLMQRFRLGPYSVGSTGALLMLEAKKPAFRELHGNDKGEWEL